MWGSDVRMRVLNVLAHVDAQAKDGGATADGGDAEEISHEGAATRLFKRARVHVLKVLLFLAAP